MLNTPPGDSFNGGWYCDGSEYVYLTPVYVSTDVPQKVRAVTGSVVSAVRMSDTGDDWIAATPITGPNGVTGYEQLDIDLERNTNVTLRIDSGLLQEQFDGWFAPMLILDYELFKPDVLPNPPHVEPPQNDDEYHAGVLDTSVILEPLKGLFLPELRIDEGWDAYIDFLLKELDVEFLRYGATNGVPTVFCSYDWVNDMLMNLDDPSVQSRYPIGIDLSSMSIVYPNPLCPARLDFGETKAMFGPMVYRADIDLGDGVVQVVHFQEVEGKNGYYEQTPVTISGEGSFRLYLAYGTNVPSTKDSYLIRLADLPEYVNPSAIQFYRKRNYELLDKNNPPISPAMLYGQLRNFGYFNFYVSFKKEGGYGSRTIDYEKYVHIDSDEKKEDLQSQEYWNMVLRSNAPIDALRDSMGGGAGTASIIGYDKRFLVSRVNIQETPLNLLECQSTPQPPVLSEITVNPTSVTLNQRGTDTQTAKVSIIPYGEFTPIFSETDTQEFSDMLMTWKDPETGEIVLLVDPINYLKMESRGITKNYDMLTYPAGPIESIDVFIEALESQLVSTYGRERVNKMLDAMERTLRAATPAWADCTINFVYPQVRSDIKLHDELVYNQERILLNGHSPSYGEQKLTLDQRGNAGVVQVSTQPDEYEFEPEVAN